MLHPWDSQTFLEGARAAGRSDQTIAAAKAAATAIKAVDRNLPVVLTLAHLAHLAGVKTSALNYIVARRLDPYRVFRLKKRSTSPRGPASRPFRIICVPRPDLMRVQRWIAKNILNVAVPHPRSYAFAPGRNLVDAASEHTGCRWLVKLDVAGFFEAIPEVAVYKVFRSLGYGALLSFQLARLCTRVGDIERDRFKPPSQPVENDLQLPFRRFPQGHLPQGAPTSPMLANLAARSLDIELDKIAKEDGWRYTRYADDLAFSSTAGSRRQAKQLSERAAHAMRLRSLSPNESKTKIVGPGARKIILGVLVDRGTPRLTKQFRNNIETHLFALTHAELGPSAHQERRGFASLIGMRRHIQGLIAFAHQVDPGYAKSLYAKFDQISWPD